MINPQPTHDSSTREELVAYLDGELDAAARQSVEERLARDAEYRSHLQSLQQAWDLLDELPRSAASESFTRTTVEMIAFSAEKDVAGLKRSAKRQQQWSWILGSGGVLVAVAIGYLIVSTRLAAPERKLLTQLPVLANLDFYRNADQLEFLRALDREGLFSGEDRASATMFAFDPQQSLADRRAILLKATAAQLSDLQVSQERFRRMSPDEQRQLTQLDQELSRDPHAPQLRQVLEHYVDWLKSLPSGQPAELRALPTEKRVAEIKRMLRDQEEQQFRRFAPNKQIPPDDTKAIFAWLDGWIERNIKQIEEQLPSMAAERLRDIPDVPRRRMMMYAMYLRSKQEKGERPGADMLAPGPADVRELEGKLSPESQKLLAKAQLNREEVRLVQEWTRAAAFRSILPTINEDELSRFYREELSAAERTRLDAMPRDEFQRELRRLIIESKIKKNQFARPFNKLTAPATAPLGEERRPMRPNAGEREGAQRRPQ